jgi:hypothetical protein
MCAASKRRVCSFDMAEVPPEGYVLAEEQGEMYFCNARWGKPNTDVASRKLDIGKRLR